MNKSYPNTRMRRNRSSKFIRNLIRETSFSIDDLHKVNTVITLLEEVSDEIIKGSFLFDFYKNDKTNIVKLGYRYIFQSNFKTLSDREVNNKVKEILSPILKIEGVSIPGM